MIFRENAGKNFTNISNNLLQNKNISYKARGIATYLLSRHEDWETSITDLTNNSPTEGKHSIKSAMKELESEGFATMNVIKETKTGKLLGKRWFISDSKNWVLLMKAKSYVPVVKIEGRYQIDTDELKNRRSEKPTVGKTDGREIRHNKEKNKQKKESNKEKNQQTSSSSSSSKNRRGANTFLLPTSDEWRAVQWWKGILEDNEYVPNSVTKAGGITHKIQGEWADELNKLHRLDGWTYNEIGQVLKWLVDTKDSINAIGQPEYGNFWFTKSKFWSLKKLRKKTRDGEKTIFGAMYDSMITSKQKPKQKRDNFTRG